ncbi:MAG: hypothetical protein KatS3mg115_1484 [Candidatus Poribacteria bacterium]|nr:MAG: hypothetical protein KatS3mg115_1484 [Candidatus Poribacteria bacterium]
MTRTKPEAETVGAFQTAPGALEEELKWLELGFEALLDPLLSRARGVIWLRLPEEPREIRIEPIGSLSESVPVTLPEGLVHRAPSAWEWLSPPLWAGTYRCTVVWTNGETLTEEIPLSAGARQLFDLTEQRLSPRTRTVRLRTPPDGLHRAVLLVGDSGTVSLELHSSSDRVRLSRLQAEGWEEIQGEAAGPEVLLLGLPRDEKLRLVVWPALSGPPGRLYRLGPATALEVPPGTQEVQLPPTASRPGSGGSVHLYWRPFGPPKGASLWIDDQLCGIILEAAEMRIEGIPPGTHSARWEWRESGRTTEWSFPVLEGRLTIIWLDPERARVFPPLDASPYPALSTQRPSPPQQGKLVLQKEFTPKPLPPNEREAP